MERQQKEQLEEEREQLEAERQQLEAVKEQLEAERQQLEAVKRRVVQQKKLLEEARQQLKEAERQTTSSADEVAQMRAALHSMQEAEKVLQKQHKNDLENERKEVEKMRVALREIHQEHTEMLENQKKEHKSALQSYTDKQKAQHARNITTIENLSDEIAILSHKIDDYNGLKAKYEDEHKRFQKLHKLHAKLRYKLQNVTGQRDQLLKQIEKLQQERNLVFAKNMKLSDVIDTIQADRDIKHDREVRHKNLMRKIQKEIGFTGADEEVKLNRERYSRLFYTEQRFDPGVCPFFSVQSPLHFHAMNLGRVLLMVGYHCIDPSNPKFDILLAKARSRSPLCENLLLTIVGVSQQNSDFLQPPLQHMQDALVDHQKRSETKV